jgi:hypothetical protein
VATVGRTALRHETDVVQRLERTDQHSRGSPLFLGHRIHQIVDAVVQIDVRDPWRPIQRGVARRRAGCGVTRRIVLAYVRLGLDDHARGGASGGAMYEHFSDERLGDRECGTIVEGRLQFTFA